MSNGQQVKRRNGYVADLKQLAAVCASGDTVEISGFAGRSPPWRRLPCRQGRVNAPTFVRRSRRLTATSPAASTPSSN
jgi:hypothetical protein